jgi:hypothetical protein
VPNLWNELLLPRIETAAMEFLPMKTFLGCAALALAIALMSVPADAKGCLKGAAVGGVAGHVAGHHGFIGAAAGCAIGHHEAKKNEKNEKNNPNQPQ